MCPAGRLSGHSCGRIAIVRNEILLHELESPLAEKEQEMLSAGARSGFTMARDCPPRFPEQSLCPRMPFLLSSETGLSRRREK